MQVYEVFINAAIHSKYSYDFKDSKTFQLKSSLTFKEENL